MTNVNKTYGWIWSCLIAGSLLLAGCADSYEETPAPQPAPQPEPQLQDESQLVARSFTRTDGAPIASSDAPIYLFACTSTTKESEGNFVYNGTSWGSTGFTIKEERQYYFYGFMTANEATGSLSVSDTDLRGDYSKGADLILTGLPAISTKDVCVVVGVSAESASVEDGHFGFLSKTKNQNYANLLMDHIYMELDLGFKIDPDYAALRTIRLTEVKLTSSYKGTVSATVKLRAGMGITGVSYERVDNSQVASQTFPLLLAEKVLDSNHLISDNPADTERLSLDKTVFCAPNLIDASGTYLTITTRYKVYDKLYDKKNNKWINNQLGEERTAINKLKLAPSTTAKKRKVTLNVKPTYLYVLSDWDMDYPEIVISNE